MKICFVLGTRPEIIKLFPLIKLCEKKKINYFIIHTGQHYTYLMDGKFLDDFKVTPKYSLKIKKNFLPTAITELSKIILKEKPDFVINQGDTNTVLASSLACNKLNYNGKKIKLVHVEAGLRSYDKSMPEEINRIITDQLSDILLVPTKESKKNLLKENIKSSKIFIVGNTISDSIKENKIKINKKILFKLKLNKNDYFLLTLHRPDMVDNKSNLKKIINYFSNLSKKKGIKIIFPIHPRTQQKIKLFNIHNFNQLHIVDPCNYFDFLALQKYAKIIFTDSGGIQEEACILKTPCVTIRKNTERPETIRIKSNILTSYNLTKIDYALNRMMKSKNKWNNPYGVNVSKKILQILTKEFKLK